MYESEINPSPKATTELSSEVLEWFAESRSTVAKRTLLPWGEHCTECVWPTCYSTCDLYSPRFDGRCRRFVDGMERIDAAETLNSYVLKISFKRWAKLWCMGNAKLYALPDADRAERTDLRVANLINFVPLSALKKTMIHKRYSLKKRKVMRKQRGGALPNCFLLECYNPNQNSARITFTLRRPEQPVPFQALLTIAPGFNRHRVAVVDIGKTFDLSSPFQVELTPNDVPEGFTLFFGAMDFVMDHAFVTPAEDKTRAKPRICKCVVWDLDNTLWDGILVEDGHDKVRLKPEIPEILKQLDDRGILISAVSKNNHDDAMAALRKFGLEEYFLFPQISWDPKSQGIQQIAASLNIGLDSLMFVDDSAFELEQVRSVVPEIMALDATEYRSILDRPECQVPVSKESKKRRIFYRDQQVRDRAQQDFRGDYFTFLRECNVRLTISPLTLSNLQRVHELTQRTNQMNFSGNRYTREQLQDFLKRDDTDTYVIDCEDRFGSYGTVGFCIVNREQTRMTDLMFSCRVQAKMVEHAVVTHLIHKYRDAGLSDFHADYRRTKKNAETGKVFAELGFEEVGEVDGVSQLVFRRTATISDHEIVTIQETAQEPAVTSSN